MMYDFSHVALMTTDRWQINFVGSYRTYTEVDLRLLLSVPGDHQLKNYHPFLSSNRVLIPAIDLDLGPIIVAASEMESKFRFRFVTSPQAYEFFFEKAEAATMFKMRV